MKLKVENVSKQFKDKLAVSNVSFDLTEGVYGFLGANGAGKTTLMRMLVTLLKPSSGRILFNGKDIDVLDEKYRDVIGYLPQYIGLYKNFTAEKYLMYIASLKGIEKEKAMKKVDELLEVVNLSEHRKRKVGKYSGGMKQRIGIAQALLNDPKVLIVDEPTAGLDPKERIRFRNLLSSISKDRIVLLSTHIVSDIEFIAKEIIVIKAGQLIHKDHPESLLDKIKDKVWTVTVDENEVPKFQAAFKVGNIVRQNDGVGLRIIAEDRPDARAIQAAPNLEDLYLYYFDQEEMIK
ncbi:ABC transporter ATP-binding protein [Chengkuizengella axinellae]|uniref:ABC transporter ATP-binding protein n=1 Tax=Chengkuizengella axinellae TaxID=3064388 RepID=A0ABT9IZB6_9BACL|nr:ABC transporter ATP-binding protein [Chengkuizengella sp. 2205SS18-9]MDP5274139.1 ABC transporter ATP-binding protein [Chengkuizengella sp. 2205SS18-9]